MIQKGCFHEDFELLSVLGKGGFGVVMEVKNKIDDCHYAVKRIGVPDLMKNKDQQERVMREVRALAMLEHPGIVRYYNSWIENPPVGWQKDKDAEMNVCEVSSEVAQETSFLPVERNKLSRNLKFNSLIGYQNGINSYDSLLKKDEDHESGKHVESYFIESDDSKSSSEAVKETVVENIDTSYLYIQMQLCKKENLSNWLKINLTRSYNTVIVYFTQLVDAMEYVHKCGIMHRDLKPSNIYFSMDGTVKIGDFGLATSSTTPQNGRISDMNEWSSHTRGCGTQLYMSPEQVVKKYFLLHVFQVLFCRVCVNASGALLVERRGSN
ncbi:eukaryotic translation initiation factor 2-alpha kinase 3-like [Uloborus diversus]|uniref:eukaryotic translation initiation factor 2-alpha kinase 3-like n=1 Tax=Uloborus diversus TaxID=327109 RepID=UPI002409B2D1|nr:eukaryotic translation initiation factor 2-alpha kinase 3-like [Uloborus diversus]